MFCKNCGTQVEEGKSFCPNCGAPIAAPVQETAAPQPSYDNNVYQQTFQSAPVYGAQGGEAPDASSIMTKGIVGAALCEIGIPGIILGNIAMKAVQQRKDEGYAYSGKLKAAYICGKVAKIVGIIMTVFWALYFLIIVLIIGNM